MTSRPHLIVALLGASLAAPATAATLHVVDANGGTGVFTSLSSAVAAAASGDVIVVRSGTYSAPDSVVIDGKSLFISCDDVVSPFLQPDFTYVTFEIRNVAAGQQVAIRGLDFTIGTWSLSNCAGSVWLEDLETQHAATNQPAIRATQCADVSIVRVNVRGASAAATFGVFLGTPALHATQSRISVNDSKLFGGASGKTPYDEGFPGPGTWIVDSQSTFAGVSIEGGGAVNTPGGNALVVSGTSASVDLVATTLTPGSGTPPGGSISGQVGLVHVLPGIAPEFEIHSPRRYGQSTTLTFHGAPGSQAWIIATPVPLLTFAPQYSGALAVDAGAAVILPVGALSPLGYLSFAAPIPSLPALEVLPLYAQPFFIQGSDLRLGAASHALLLDPSF